MIDKTVLVTIFACVCLAISSFAGETAPVVKPTIAKICINCHKAEPNAILGYFDNVAFKAKTIQVKIDDVVELIKFDEDEVKVVTAEGKNIDGDALHQTKKGHEIRIEFTEKDGVKTAVKVIEKPPIKISQGMLISTAEVEKLVAIGPEKGKYFLYDSRPLPRFQEGAIPTAINLPFPAFDEMAAKLLPPDKNALVIFYCTGPTCSMSPGSATKAKALGYTNIKVYKDGIPGWSAKNYTVLSAQSLKEAWIDKDMPHVTLDARPARDASRGSIKGAVSFPAVQAAKLIKNLPPAEKKPPVVVYDDKGGKQAEEVAKVLLKAGYENVKVLLGGIDGWKAAKFETVAGKLAVKASYSPKPRPGEINLDEFKRYAAELPLNVVILDVRNPDEFKAGMLKGAKNIPTEELKGRAAEIPRDRLVITMCTTGVRAEMAYHALKELGYANVRFLNAKIVFEKDGSYKISKE